MRAVDAAGLQVVRLDAGESALATGKSAEGAEIRTPMALTVVGGLLTSTLLTLVVIPALYLLLDRRRHDIDPEAVARS